MQGISNSRGQIQLPAEVYLALMYEQCKNTLMSFTAVLGDKIWRNLNEPAWSLNLLKWEEEQKRNSFVCQKVFFLFRVLSVLQDLVPFRWSVLLLLEWQRFGFLAKKLLWKPSEIILTHWGFESVFQWMKRKQVIAWRNGEGSTKMQFLLCRQV